MVIAFLFHTNSLSLMIVVNWWLPYLYAYGEFDCRAICYIVYSKLDVIKNLRIKNGISYDLLCFGRFRYGKKMRNFRFKNNNKSNKLIDIFHHKFKTKISFEMFLFFIILSDLFGFLTKKMLPTICTTFEWWAFVCVCIFINNKKKR